MFSNIIEGYADARHVEIDEVFPDTDELELRASEFRWIKIPLADDANAESDEGHYLILGLRTDPPLPTNLPDFSKRP